MHVFREQSIPGKCSCRSPFVIKFLLQLFSKVLMATLFAAVGLFLALFISRSDAAACQEITDEASCVLQASCAWQNDPNEAIGETSCYCDSQEPLDVIFLLDESGSMGYDNFRQEVQFVIDMIQTSLAPESNVHITKFGSRIRPVWNFTEDQSNGWSDATTALDNTAYYGGGTRMC